MKSAQHYDTVADAIRFVKRRAKAQPELAEVAAHVGMSEFHLQRVFTAWAGISPKRFLQFLTVEHAKAALARSSDVLDAALSVGLSGPSRLHDLTVACEAMTPGEIKSGGAGLEVRTGRAQSPFGDVVVGVTERGVCHFEFAATDAHLRRRLPAATFVVDDKAARSVVDKTVAGERSPLLVKGTNFQVQVWRALLEVPAGALIPYGALAARAGHAGASRAVGTAVGKNEIALLIPCHRVIREDGVVGNYRWGAERKSALLAYESASAV